MTRCGGPPGRCRGLSAAPWPPATDAGGRGTGDGGRGTPGRAARDTCVLCEDSESAWIAGAPRLGRCIPTMRPCNVQCRAGMQRSAGILEPTRAFLSALPTAGPLLLPSHCPVSSSSQRYPPVICSHLLKSAGPLGRQPRPPLLVPASVSLPTSPSHNTRPWSPSHYTR